MSCAKCERPFRYGTEDTVTINKKTYHSDCLSCDNCSKAYDGSFLPDQLDQQALCRECSHMNQTKSATNLQSASTESKNNVLCCGGCGIPFNPSSRHITKKYRNREYHHNCLKCHECQALIEGEIYEDEQNTKIYCTSCFKRRDQQGFQKQNQQKKLNQQKTVHFAEKLAETLNRDELEAYYKNDQGHNTLICTIHYKTIGDPFSIVHHTVATYAFGYVLTLNVMPYFANFRLLAELSTPSVNLRWFLDVLKYPKTSKIFVLNGLSMTLIFFFVRIIAMPIYWWKVYVVAITPLWPHMGHFRYILIVVCIVLDIINLYWFSKMARGCVRTLMAANNKKRG
ncbi:unnamed protein product [Rotaria magnacalcarata]|uniref:LIM zinc-binding domain-containing protein n=1 Tax=Rotaria magnacalcarata TaxID=392030 RepID=A0A818YGB0_9BILA|nr:unnamed protein product [Rotaria magnacalcarata]